MIVLFREVLAGCVEHGPACTALGVEAARRIWALGELACHAGAALGPPWRGGLVAGGSAFAFCPRDGGSEELSGVLGGCPSLASSSAMRARRALFCANSSSIRISNCCTSGFRLSASSESSFSGAIPSLNQPAALVQSLRLSHAAAGGE